MSVMKVCSAINYVFSEAYDFEYIVVERLLLFLKEF